MTELQIFNFQERQVRTAIIDGSPWWVLNDVCEVLGIVNPKQVAVRLEEDERGVYPISTPGGVQDARMVNEPGLYSVILRSDKPEARLFKRWITHEVLPAIRETGGYGLAKVPQTYAEALRLAADQAEKIALDAPKVAFYDTAMEATNAKDMGEVAKVLNIPGLGRNNLFAFLREKGVLNADNEPYQYYVSQGWFKLVEYLYQTGSGVQKVGVKTVVFQKGIDGILKLINAKSE